MATLTHARLFGNNHRMLVTADDGTTRLDVDTFMVCRACGSVWTPAVFEINGVTCPMCVACSWELVPAVQVFTDGILVTADRPPRFARAIARVRRHVQTGHDAARQRVVSARHGSARTRASDR